MTIDKNVHVTVNNNVLRLRNNADETIRFKKGQGRKKIQWQLVSAPGWSWLPSTGPSPSAPIVFTGATDGQFPDPPGITGANLTLDDIATMVGEYKYTLFVVNGSGTVLELDPKIINEV